PSIDMACQRKGQPVRKCVPPSRLPFRSGCLHRKERPAECAIMAYSSKQNGERSVEREGKELEAAHEAIRHSEELLANEVEAAWRLHQLATQLITAQGSGALFEQILDTAQSLVHSDFATIQMFYPERGT